MTRQAASGTPAPPSGTHRGRQLVFTSQPIHEIAYDLAFSDPSHFARFFRKQTGTTPHEFRAARGG